MAADRTPLAPDRPDAFISYSRRDKTFVESCIVPPLEERGKDLWIDVDDIHGGAADWRAKVWAGIEASRVVVFVLSPDSLASKVCAEELAQAIALNKRIIPVLRRTVDDLPVPEALARPNWILAREEDDLDKAIAALVTALENDEAWLSLHARLTQRTGEWLRADRDPSYLLRGSDLRAAEQWLAEQREHAQSPTAEQAAYIAAGRSVAARRQRLLLAGVLLALGVSVALGLVANDQRLKARAEQRSAQSQALAARAIDAARRDPERALNLALDAADLNRSALVRRALREAVAASSWTHILRHENPSPVSEAEFSRDASLAVTAGEAPAATLWEVRSGRRLASLEHADDIHSARFSPDGRRIVTASADGTARVWDWRGHQLDELDAAGGDVWSAEFSADGRRVITATDGGAAQVWDLSRRGSRVTLPGSAADHLAAASLSPDGRHALTPAARDTLALWTVDRRPRRLVLRPPEGTQRQATVAIFTPDGRRVVAGYDNGTVCVWMPARSARAASCYHAQDRTITEVVVDRAGARYVTASADGTAILRRMSGGPPLATLRHQGPINGAAFDRSTGRIVTSGEDRTARLWTPAGKPERVLRGHADAVVVARFSRSGSQLITGSDDGSARIWSARPATRFLPGPALPGADAAFSRDGRRLLAVDAAGRAALWDLSRRTTDPLGPMLPTDDELNSPCGRFTGCSPWAPDGLSIAGVDPREEATVWDVRTGEPRALGVSGAGSAGFSPDGRRLAVVRFHPSAALVVRRSGGPPVSEVAARMAIHSARFTADGRKLLTVTYDGAVRVSDTLRGTPAGPSITAAGARAAAISPDGVSVAVGTAAGRLEVHSTGRPRRSRKLTRSITALAFDPTGARILTVGDDRTVRVWKTTSPGVPTAVLRGHSDRLLSAEFSPNGDGFVLTASRDGTARVWDPALEMAILVMPMGTAGAARFSPDGRSVAVAGRRTLELHECVACAPLDALRRIARALLPDR